MKKYLLPILSILFVFVFPLAATSYPFLDNNYEVENGDEVLLDQEDLQSFINQWQDSSIITFAAADKELRQALIEHNPDLEQLQSLYRMQQQQMAYQEREQGLKVGLSSQPLYSISRRANQTPVGGYDLSNTFGVGASISKKLGTGAVATLSASQKSDLTENSNSVGSWEWTHSPSASLTINQPLWVGDGLIDTNYSKKQLEQNQISSDNAKLSFNQLLEALVLQGNNQISTLQALKESRFLLGEQLIIEKASINDAKKDLEEGRISANAYDSRVLGLNQLRYSLTEVEKQIETIKSSLKTLWGGNNYPKQVIVDSELIEELSSKIFDKNKLVKILLENDYAYAQALGKLRLAELDAMLNSPSDAPMLNVSLQISPEYTASSGDFFTSFDNLLTSSTPTFSLSIGFSATDLSRSTTKLSSSLADESVLQAKLEVESARNDLEIKVDDIQRNIKGLLLNLSVGLYDFEQRTNDIEVERIRFEIGLANDNSIRAKEIAQYDSAFMVLQTLRELDLIALDLSSRGLDL